MYGTCFACTSVAKWRRNDRESFVECSTKGCPSKQLALAKRKNKWELKENTYNNLMKFNTDSHPTSYIVYCTAKVKNETTGKKNRCKGRMAFSVEDDFSVTFQRVEAPHLCKTANVKIEGCPQKEKKQGKEEKEKERTTNTTGVCKCVIQFIISSHYYHHGRRSKTIDQILH